MDRYIIIILGVGLLTRLFLFVYFLDVPLAFWDDDTNTYLYTAENIRLGNGFTWDTEPPYMPDAFRTPGYPAFLLLNRVIFGNYETALIVQSLMVVGIALIVFLLAKDLGYKNISYWAAAVFLAMPFSIQVSLKFLTQSLFAFVLIIAVWFWIKFLKSNTNKYLLITALLLPVLALIRPIAQFVYLPFFFSFVYASWIYGRFKIKEIFKVGLVLGVIFFVGILPWLYRNYSTFGHFSISSIIPSQMYFYDSPAVYAYNHDISYHEAATIISKKAEEHFDAEQGKFSALFSSGAYLKEKALDIMLERPSSLFIVRGIQFFKFFIRDGIHYWSESPLPSPRISIEFIRSMTPLLFFVMLERVLLFLLFLGMSATAVVSFWDANKESRVIIGFLILIILYFATLSGIMSSAGLRYPVEALFVLTGLLGIAKVGNKILNLYRV